MSQTTTPLRVTPQAGIHYAFEPSGIMSSGAAAATLPPRLRQIIPDDCNILFASTTGETVTIKLGGRTRTDAGAQAYNGVRLFSDMSVVRGLYVRIIDTAPQTAPAWTGEAGTSVTLGYLADCGAPGANQTAAANRIMSWSPAGVFAAGDFTYNLEVTGTPGGDADVAVWSVSIAGEYFFPAMGNHEHGAAGLKAWLVATFGDYIDEFNEVTYYERLFYGDGTDPDPLIQALVLDTALETNGAAVTDAESGGGLRYGSYQWQFIYDRMRSVANARYRIAFLHHPAVTSAGDATQETLVFETAVAQLARSGWFDAIFVGHVHTYERFDHHGTPVINTSSSVRDLSVPGRPLTGAVGGATLVKSSTARCVSKIVATPDDFTVITYDLAGTEIDRLTVQPRPRPFGKFSLKLSGFHIPANAETPSTGDWIIDLGKDADFLLTDANGLDVDSATAAVSIETATTAGDPAEHYCRHLKAEIYAIGA